MVKRKCSLEGETRQTWIDEFELGSVAQPTEYISDDSSPLVIEEFRVPVDAALTVHSNCDEDNGNHDSDDSAPRPPKTPSPEKAGRKYRLRRNKRQEYGIKTKEEVEKKRKVTLEEQKKPGKGQQKGVETEKEDGNKVKDYDEDIDEKENEILGGENAFTTTTCLLPENPLADVIGRYYGYYQIFVL